MLQYNHSKESLKFKKKGKCTMTNREFYTAVINGTITEDMVTFATEAIEKLDARNAKRSEKPSKTQIANEPIKAKIAEYLGRTDEHDFATASEIATELEISTQKASALCRQMVNDGLLNVEDVKVKGKGTQKAYALA